MLSAKELAARSLPVSPGLLSTLSNLAATQHQRANYAGAEANYREALRTFEKKLSPDHPNVLTALSNLGLATLEQGKLEEANDVLQQALAAERRVLGPTHPQVGETTEHLGVLRIRQERFREAEALLRESVAIFRSAALAPSVIAVAESELGEALAGQGRYADAETLMVPAGAAILPSTKPEREKRRAVERVVGLYDAWGKPEKAAEWRAKLPKDTPATK